MENTGIPDKYDGIHFIPHKIKNKTGLQFYFFDLDNEYANGVPIESTSLGDKWFIVYLKSSENGYPFYDNNTEAIFADPIVYLKGLAGKGIYGTMVRKTDKSIKWFEDFLENILKNYTKNGDDNVQD